MRNPDTRQLHIEKLREQGYFSMSSDERAATQQKSMADLRSMRHNIREAAQRYAKEVRKGE